MPVFTRHRPTGWGNSLLKRLPPARTAQVCFDAGPLWRLVPASARFLRAEARGCGEVHEFALATPPRPDRTDQFPVAPFGQAIESCAVAGANALVAPQRGEQG